MPVFVFVIMAILVGFVLPLWIVFHYITRWRAQRTLSAVDEQTLADLHAAAVRLEARLQALEQAVGAPGPESGEKS